jgi:hypothetical protein
MKSGVHLQGATSNPSCRPTTAKLGVAFIEIGAGLEERKLNTTIMFSTV